MAASSSSSASVVSSVTLRALLALAWPMVVSRASQVVIGLCDALMVAHLGSAALAATSAGAFNTYAVLILPFGVTFIVSSFTSQLFGKGDLAGARRYGFYGLLVAIAAQLLCLAAIPVMPAVLGALPYADDVRMLMRDYLALRFLSGGAAMGIEALANYYGGLGNTRLPMRINLVAMALNVALNWVLIGGRLGAPALGVEGAAIASTVATSTAFAIFFAYFLREGRGAGGVFVRLHAREFVRLLRFGVPAGFNWFMEFFAFNVFVNVVVAGLGTSALAGLMAVFQINAVSFMPAFAVAGAGAILVGQTIGAGDKDRVPGVVRLTFLTNAVWQGAVGAIYLAFPALLLSPFAREGADGAALMEVGVRMLMLSSAWQLFDAAVNTVAEALRAAGDTAFTMWARAGAAWLLFLPGSYFSVRVAGGGDVVAVGWVVFYLALLAAILFVRFRRGAWRRIDLIEPSPAP